MPKGGSLKHIHAMLFNWSFFETLEKVRIQSAGILLISDFEIAFSF